VKRRMGERVRERGSDSLAYDVFRSGFSELSWTTPLLWLSHDPHKAAADGLVALIEVSVVFLRQVFATQGEIEPGLTFASFSISV
jgi:hypothetical protein